MDSRSNVLPKEEYHLSYSKDFFINNNKSFDKSSLNLLKLSRKYPKQIESQTLPKGERMSNLKEVILMDGESIVTSIEGDAYNSSSNPIQKVFGKVSKILGKIIGKSMKVYFVKTSQRLMLVEKKVLFWAIPTDTHVSTLSYDSIDMVGYKQEKRWLLFSSQYFMLSMRNGETVNIKYTGTVEELSNLAYSMNETLYGSPSKMSVAA